MDLENNQDGEDDIVDEGARKNNDPETNQQVDEDDGSPPMCSICYTEPPINAIQLDCSHVFCYICIKGASERTRACPLCRAEIGIEFNYQEHPIIGTVCLPTPNDGFYWFYEGFRGWWLYDAVTNRILEDAYQRDEALVDCFIAGYNYEIDLRSLTQRRKDGEGRVRKIIRATLNQGNIIGMSGIKGRDFDELFEMMKVASQNTIPPK